MSAVCGHAGAVPTLDPPLHVRMLDALAHRSQSVSAPGSVRSDAAALGHAVVAHAFTDALRPNSDAAVARSADGRMRCALDGWLFNAEELAGFLRGRGIDVAVTNHAGIIANLLALEPAKDALARLDGQFALAATDGERTLLARDALGERPLYFAQVGGALLFASEIKALLSHPEFEVRTNQSSLSSLLVFSFIPGPATMFEGVQELEAGHVLQWRPGDTDPRAEPYWELREDIIEDIGEVACAEQVRTLCVDAVRRRIPADGKVSAFLSGGLDSSAVVALMVDMGIRPQCFSVAFGVGQPNELGYARMVADRCGVDHEIIDVEPEDFLDTLPSILWQLDDPLCDCITVPNFIMAEAAAKHAPVVFNGEGGDPLFGGPKNKFMILGEWYKGLGGYDRCTAYLASYHKFYDYYGLLCTPSFLEGSGGIPALVDVVRPYLDNPQFDSFLNRLMLINTKLKGGQNILIKVDKMLSAHGVRACSPLFDRELTEYSFRIPPTLKRRGDIEKYALKKAVDHLLPHPVVYRKKSGMGVPLNHWFRATALREYTHDILRSQRARERGYFHQSFVDDLLQQHPPDYVFGRDRTGELLWMLLAVELWHRVYVDGERP